VMWGKDDLSTSLQSRLDSLDRVGN
jgi:hypothetical protein